MLTTLIITIPITFLTLLANLFPIASSMASGVASALSSASSSLWALNAFIPVPTIALATGIAVSVEIVLLSFRFARFIISYIPFFGGKGV